MNSPYEQTQVRVVVRVFPGVHVTGAEHLATLRGERPCGRITVSNHVHPLDCAMLATQARRRVVGFTVARANFESPVVGFLVRHLGSIPVPRKGDAADRARFDDQVAARIARGHAVHFFPEGDLAPYDTTLREFRPGAFTTAARLGVPVVPMVFTPGRRRRWRRRPTFRLHILPPVPPDGADATVLAARVREAMLVAHLAHSTDEN